MATLTLCDRCGEEIKNRAYGVDHITVSHRNSNSFKTHTQSFELHPKCAEKMFKHATNPKV